MSTQVGAVAPNALSSGTSGAASIGAVATDASALTSAGGATAPGASSSRAIAFRMPSPSVLVMAALFAWLYARPMYLLGRDWWNNPEAGHGLLLAPLALWFAWKSGIHPDARPNRLVGFALILGGVFFRYVSDLAAELFTMRGSMLMAAAGLVVVVLRLPAAAALVAAVHAARAVDPAPRADPQPHRAAAAVHGVEDRRGAARVARDPGAADRERHPHPRPRAVRRRGVQRAPLAHRAAQPRRPARRDHARVPDQPRSCCSRRPSRWRSC